MVLFIAILNYLAIGNIIDSKSKLEATLKSVGSLFMWLKLLYFFRINKQAGYLIRMLFKVIFGMRTFLVVLLITIIAVADAQISLYKSDDKDSKNVEISSEFLCKHFFRFINAVFLTYRMITGGGEDKPDIDPLYIVQYDILLLFSSLFLMIVMLNLLISIIGNIFGDVQAN